MIILAMAGPYGFGICNDVLVQVKNLLTVISTDGNIISSVKKIIKFLFLGFYSLLINSGR
jgi:hypothetical protein